ncbi:MAG: RloB family protein [Prolixibacteraceae bacterium]|nr:RloB family protein [Prolixibacteraceae bacterium]
MTNRKPKDLKTPWKQRELRNKREITKREKRNLFRIYCEGENTEPEYFKCFPVNTETNVYAIGLGYSKTSLVKKVISLLKEDKMLVRQNNYDPDRQLWVVFDFDKRGDINEKQDFNNAIELANRNNVNVAYSNDCFELWLILHDKYQAAAITRFEYYQMLSDKFNCNYEKDGKSINFAKSLYSIYLSGQSRAIQNAERLLNDKADLPFADQNPCTTVFKLVQELNKCLKK